MTRKKSEPETLRTEQEIQAEYSQTCAELGDMILRTYIKLQAATIKVQSLNLELSKVKTNENNENKT